MPPHPQPSSSSLPPPSTSKKTEGVAIRPPHPDTLRHKSQSALINLPPTKVVSERNMSGFPAKPIPKNNGIFDKLSGASREVKEPPKQTTISKDSTWITARKLSPTAKDSAVKKTSPFANDDDDGDQHLQPMRPVTTSALQPHGLQSLDSLKEDVADVTGGIFVEEDRCENATITKSVNTLVISYWHNTYGNQNFRITLTRDDLKWACAYVENPVSDKSPWLILLCCLRTTHDLKRFKQGEPEKPGLALYVALFFKEEERFLLVMKMLGSILGTGVFMFVQPSVLNLSKTVANFRDTLSHPCTNVQQSAARFFISHYSSATKGQYERDLRLRTFERTSEKPKVPIKVSGVDVAAQEMTRSNPIAARESRGSSMIQLSHQQRSLIPQPFDVSRRKKPVNERLSPLFMYPSTKKRSNIASSALLASVDEDVSDDDEVQIISCSTKPTAVTTSVIQPLIETFTDKFSLLRSIVITVGDRLRLEPGEYLNDTCVDWWLNFIYLRGTLGDEDRKRMHMFSSFFYRTMKQTRLRIKASSIDEKIRSEHPNFDLEDFRQDEAFVSVQRWTRGVDLFTKEWIFIPVCYGMHWSLAVIVNSPQLARCLDQMDDRLRKVTGVKRPGSLDAASNLPDTVIEDEEENLESEEMKPEEEEEEEDDAGRDDTTLQDVEETDEFVDLTSDIMLPLRSNTDGDAQLAASLAAGELGEELQASASTSPYFNFGSDHYKSLLELLPLSDDSTPAVILLDSLGCHSANQVLPIIRSYIIREWRYRKNGGQPLGGTDILSLQERNRLFAQLIPEASPSCQEQDNSTDCGLFALKFVESFVKFSTVTQSPAKMRMPAETITRKFLQDIKFSKTIKSWFTVEDVYHLRAIMKAVCNTCLGTEESGTGESNLQKLSHPRMIPSDEGESTLVACKMEALFTLSEKQKVAVEKKKKEIDDAMIEDSRNNEDPFHQNHMIPISVNNSDNDIEEIVNEKQQHQLGKKDSEKSAKKSVFNESRESGSILKRKRSASDKGDHDGESKDMWNMVQEDTGTHKGKRFSNIPGLPPSPPR